MAIDPFGMTIGVPRGALAACKATSSSCPFGRYGSELSELLPEVNGEVPLGPADVLRDVLEEERRSFDVDAEEDVEEDARLGAVRGS